jgi:hypothetical protein
VICSACKVSYSAPNQHGQCPACGKTTGTPEERDLDAQLAKKVRWFEYYEQATQDARDTAHRCRDFYDGDQWDDEDLDDLAERNQAPVVINRIFKKVNYLTGLGVQGRADPKALPRTPQHEEDVQAITDALRFVVDQQDFDQVDNDALEEKYIEGTSGAIVEVDKSSEDLDIVIRHVEFDRLFYDPHSRKRDFSDAKYLGISTWMDLEDAKDYWRGRDDAVENSDEVLETAMEQRGEGEAHADKPSVWFDKERNRVRWAETYYRENGRWYVCFNTQGGFLVLPKPTGYVDDRGNDVCPLIADTAYIDRKLNRYGLVKHMLWPQQELNKRRSKEMHWQSVDRVIYEPAALEDPDGFATEWAKPDARIRVRQGALGGNGDAPRFQTFDGSAKAAQQHQMMMQSSAEMDLVGPDAPQLAATQGASGRELLVRQQIGNLEIARVLDSHRRWRRQIYRHIWWRVRQFWTDEKWLRVTDEEAKTGYRFVGLNRRITRGQRFSEMLQKGVPAESAVKAAGIPPEMVKNAVAVLTRRAQESGAQVPPEQIQQAALSLMMRHPAMQQPLVAGDTAQLDVDVIIEEAPDTAIVQAEEYESYMQTLPTLVNADQANTKEFVAIGIELSGSRHKKKALAILRKPPDPKQAQQQQMMLQIQLAEKQAEIDMLKARAQRDNAAAAKDAAAARAIPAGMQKDLAAAAKTGAEAQLGVPAAAQRDVAQARKHEAETTAHVIVAVPNPERGMPL